MLHAFALSCHRMKEILLDLCALTQDARPEIADQMTDFGFDLRCSGSLSWSVLRVRLLASMSEVSWDLVREECSTGYRIAAGSLARPPRSRYAYAYACFHAVFCSG